MENGNATPTLVILSPESRFKKYFKIVFKTKWSSLTHQYIQTGQTELFTKWNLNYCPKVKCKTRVPTRVSNVLPPMLPKHLSLKQSTKSEDLAPCAPHHTPHYYNETACRDDKCLFYLISTCPSLWWQTSLADLCCDFEKTTKVL